MVINSRSEGRTKATAETITQAGHKASFEVADLLDSSGQDAIRIPEQ